MSNIADLVREAQETTAAVQSLITFTNGLAQKLKDNAADPAVINQIAAELEANQTAIGAILNPPVDAPPEVIPPADPVPVVEVPPVV